MHLFAAGCTLVITHIFYRWKEQAFPEWSELKGAYRFFSNPNVRYEEILAPHWERTRPDCTEPGEYLLVEDTTDLDYSSHEACEGLGPLSADFYRGLKLHSTLAVRVDGWDLNQCPEVTVVGVAGQKCWMRSGPTRRQKKESRRQQMLRPRESDRWGETLSLLPERPAAATWIYIADREADLYEAYERCLEHRIDFIIRGNHARRLMDEERSLFEVVGQASVLGRLGRFAPWYSLRLTNGELSDPARGTRGLQPGCDGGVRSAC